MERKVDTDEKTFLAKPESSFSLGKTRAGTKYSGWTSYLYKNAPKSQSRADSAGNDQTGKTTAAAHSELGEPGDQSVEQTGFWNYKAKVYAEVNPKGANPPAMSAEARVRDPQYFDPAGLALEPIVLMSVTFEEGTGVFVDDPMGEAWLHCDGTSSLLADSIWSLSAHMSLMGTMSVVFNPHPSLGFSMNEAALIDALTDASFFSPTGLTEEVVLFYSIDTSYFSVTEDDWLGSYDEALANFVPSPSTFVLASLGGFAFVRRRR